MQILYFPEGSEPVDLNASSISVEFFFKSIGEIEAASISFGVKVVGKVNLEDVASTRFTAPFVTIALRYISAGLPVFVKFTLHKSAALN